MIIRTFFSSCICLLYHRQKQIDWDDWEKKAHHRKITKETTIRGIYDPSELEHLHFLPHSLQERMLFTMTCNVLLYRWRSRLVPCRKRGSVTPDASRGVCGCVWVCTFVPHRSVLTMKFRSNRDTQINVERFHDVNRQYDTLAIVHTSFSARGKKVLL